MGKKKQVRKKIEVMMMRGSEMMRVEWWKQLIYNGF